ncbi:hypothetical protein EB796_012730 [Bugula neritina]|uniref:Uncharacterized protein n=1 Tax=Bugula neritina TaxID=10212 RepID=A0A7J7JRK5_BUGNE|nr:hypothetical protein EB796_012730 [Bugula neritina]
MHRQLKRYFEGGKLYELPAEQLVLASNAPADNMISESFLGLADNFYRSANASDAHISAKIRFPNMTSDWVNNLDNDSLYAAIGPARALLDKSKLNAVEVKDEISERLKTRVQERANGKRRSMTLNIKSLMRDPSSFSEKVASACLDIPPERVDTILEIIKSPGNLVGTEFVWIWNNDGSDTCYHYRVVGSASASSGVSKFLAVDC